MGEGGFKISFILSWGFIQISKLIFSSNYNFGHILQQPCNFCKIVNGAFLTWSGIFISLGWGVGAAGCADLAVCFGVCWFICGRLGMILAACCSVVFVLANMTGQMRRSGGWRDHLLAVGGLLYLGVCSWVALCLAVFAVWPGVGGSGLC